LEQDPRRPQPVRRPRRRHLDHQGDQRRGFNGLDDRRRYLGRAKQALARYRRGRKSPTASRRALRPMLRRGLQGGTRSRCCSGCSRRPGYAVGIDGDFGPGTEAVVKAFQSANGLGN
jgi:peptidoglycan hydrolase-like protein with peptidoglycan-binding domain